MSGSARPELTPEVFADLLRNVEAPPVDTEARPVLDRAEDHRAHRRRVEVQLRQGRQVPPRLVAQHPPGCGPILVAAATDALDGHLARNWGLVSVFGRIMDPFADKLLVIGAFAFLAGPGFWVCRCFGARSSPIPMRTGGGMSSRTA